MGPHLTPGRRHHGDTAALIAVAIAISVLATLALLGAALIGVSLLDVWPAEPVDPPRIGPYRWWAAFLG
jgi:hypothetical protein